MRISSFLFPAGLLLSVLACSSSDDPTDVVGSSGSSGSGGTGLDATAGSGGTRSDTGADGTPLDAVSDAFRDAPLTCVSSVPSGAAPPSCQGGATGAGMHCGASGSGDCCASALVPCGSFNRNNQPTEPSAVSDYRLDTYLITVGRFRAFASAGMGTRTSPPAVGAGASPHAAGTGWDSAYSGRLVAENDAGTALATAVQCNAINQTWTAGDDALPMNCITWFEAFAFCVWDGGRLPTDLEYDYAAAGGAEQRTYSWGNTAPGPNADLAVYGCYYGGSDGGCAGVGSLAPVGSVSAGAGKWGQADLAGELWAWAFDWYKDYTGPCYECVNLENSFVRVARGGSFTSVATSITSSYRTYYDPSTRNYSVGARCARNVP
jgi:formylglycine-generating enzyme